jgi:hypothetical protein
MATSTYAKAQAAQKDLQRLLAKKTPVAAHDSLGNALRAELLTRRPKGAAPPTIQREIDRRRGQGRSLAAEVRAPLEREAGMSLADVVVHTDAQAGRLAQLLGSKAFTTGQDIFFAPGHYNPASVQGRSIIRHEVGHVLQQRTGEAVAALHSDSAYEALERKAEQAFSSRAVSPYAALGAVPALGALQPLPVQRLSLGGLISMGTSLVGAATGGGGAGGGVMGMISQGASLVPKVMETVGLLRAGNIAGVIAKLKEIYAIVNQMTGGAIGGALASAGNALGIPAGAAQGAASMAPQVMSLVGLATKGDFQGIAAQLPQIIAGAEQMLATGGA